MSNQNTTTPDPRRQAFRQVVNALPDTLRFRFLQIPDHEITEARFQELGDALSQSVRRGELSRRAFMKIFGIVGAGGLWSLLFPHRSEAWQAWTGFWQNTQNNPAATYTGPDPYWDYVTLLLQFDGANGSTLFPDESNVGKAPTLAGTPYIDTSAGSNPYSGKTGSAKFNGSSDYLSFADSNDWSLGSGNFTIECWVYMTAPGAGQPFLGQWDGGAGQRSWNFFFNGSGLAFNISSDGTTATPNSAAWSPTANTWYHVAASRSGNTLKLFVNGTQLGSDISLTSTLFDSSRALEVGAFSANSLYLSGSLADLRIYKGAAKYTANFTPRTAPIGLGSYSDPYWGYCVLACPFDNSLKDCSGKKATANGNATLSSTTKKYGSASASFDGTNSYISIPSDTGFAFGTGDFTLEYFLYLAQAPTSGMAIIDGVGTGQFGVSVSSTTISAFASNVGSLLNVTYSVPTATWTHIAFVRASGTLYCFVNGTLQGSASCTYDLTSPGNFIIGVNQNLSSYFLNGSIDSLRITKGYARYTTDFIPPSVAFPVGKDETVDPFWNSTALAMHMDDLTDATGRHAITNNGSVTNSTSVYRYGTASASFSGSSQFLSLADSTDFAFGSGDFTIELFVYPNSTAGNNCLIGKRSSSGGCGPFLIWLASGTAYLFLSSNGSSWDLANALPFAAIPTSAWTHLAVTRRGSTITLFKDGAAVNTATTSSALAVNTELLRIGGESNAAYLNGYIDEVRITKGVARYAQSFTPPTRAFATTPLSNQTDYDYFYDKVVLLLLMDDANFTDQTGRHTITNNGSVQLSASTAKFGSSASFSGSNNLSSADSADWVLQDFTIEFWVCLTANTAWQTILSQEPYGISIQTLSTPKVGCYLSSSGTAWDLTLTSTSTLSLNRWYHLALSRSGSHVKLFLNGSIEASAMFSGKTFDTSGSLNIGNNQSTYYLNGSLDDLRITKGLARYTSNFAPPARAFSNSQGIVTSNLVALLDTGECQSTNAPLVTNLLGASQQFDNSTIWSRGYITLTANAAAAPDGTTTATLFADDSNNQVHDLWQYHTIPSGTVVTMSVYAKAQGWSRVMFRDSGSGQHAIFYLSGSGSVTAQTAGATPSIQALSNGWYRLSVTYTIASAGPNFILRLVDDTGSWTFAGTGTKGIYIWGAQLEASPSVGPYVRTGQNLLSYSEQFDNSVWTAAYSSVTANAVSAPDGTLSADFLKEDNTTNGHYIWHSNASANGNTIYTYSCYVKANGRTKLSLELYQNSNGGCGNDFDLSAGTVTIGTPYTGASNANGSISSIGNGWYRCSITLQTSSTQTSLTAQLRLRDGANNSSYLGDGTSGVYVWGGQLEAVSSAGPYVKTPATGVTYRGGAPTTNLLTYSEQFDNAAWSKAGGTVTANTTTAPDGASTADTFLEDSSTGFHYVNQVFSYTAGTTIAGSWFVKANGRTCARLTLQGASDNIWAQFDLSAGTLGMTYATGTGSVLGAWIQSVGNGWYRISLSGVPSTSATSVTFQINTTLTSTGSGNIAGDTSKGLYLWGAQLELGNQPGPYVPTTSAAATGGGQLCNLVALPADGSPQSAYDFKFGDGSTSTTFPTFTGITGGRSVNDYFSFDGGDHLRAVQPNTAFLNSLHKKGTSLSIVVVCSLANAAADQTLFATRDMATPGGLGIGFCATAGGAIRFVVGKGDGTNNLVQDSTTLALTANRPMILGLSFNETSSSGRFYLNGKEETFSASYASQITTDLGGPACIGAGYGSGAFWFLSNGSKIFQVLLYNTNLSKSQLDQIFNATRGRYGV